jgi:hypothetical protein
MAKAKTKTALELAVEYIGSKPCRECPIPGREECLSQDCSKTIIKYFQRKAKEANHGK